jgi:hypothetical protein
MWLIANPLDGTGGRSDRNCSAWRNLLIESDTMDADAQLERMLAMFGGSLACITWSGSKSWHGIARVPAQSAQMFTRMAARAFSMCFANGYEVDMHNANPARLTRLAGATRNESIQRLLAAWPRDSWKEWTS